jgi:hypothetical protein
MPTSTSTTRHSPGTTADRTGRAALPNKVEERYERNKRKEKKYKLPEYSRDRCQYVDIKGVCGSKVNGLLEVVDNGRPALVPVCDKHLELLQATPDGYQESKGHICLPKSTYRSFRKRSP